MSSWAIARPEWIAGLAKIYPVFDLRAERLGVSEFVRITNMIAEARKDIQ